MRELVVGIFVIERDDAFVGIKDVPVEKEKINKLGESQRHTTKGRGNG